MKKKMWCGMAALLLVVLIAVLVWKPLNTAFLARRANEIAEEYHREEMIGTELFRVTPIYNLENEIDSYAYEFREGHRVPGHIVVNVSSGDPFITTIAYTGFGPAYNLKSPPLSVPDNIRTDRVYTIGSLAYYFIGTRQGNDLPVFELGRKISYTILYNENLAFYRQRVAAMKNSRALQKTN